MCSSGEIVPIIVYKLFLYLNWKAACHFFKKNYVYYALINKFVFWMQIQLVFYTNRENVYSSSTCFWEEKDQALYKN